MRKSTNSNTVVARMTVTRADNSKVIVEIHSNATFYKFYHFYSQTGNRRSTKKEIRTASRNEGVPTVNAHLFTPGLEMVQANFLCCQVGRIAAVISIKMRILRRKMYRELVNMAPDVLGLVKVDANPFAKRPQPVRYPIRLPEAYTPIKKRWEILSGVNR